MGKQSQAHRRFLTGMTSTATEVKKKLFLIFHGRFPSNKAASLFAAKSAEAFALEGFDVTLIVSRRLGRGKEDPYGYYKVKDNFRITYLPVLDLPSKNHLTSLRFILSSFSFAVSCYVYLLRHARKEDIIYSNESLPLFLASVSFPQTFYEMHDFPERGQRLFGMFMRRMSWVLIHNTWKTDTAKKLFRLEENRVLREPNAVQIEEFDIPVSKIEAREKLSLPQDKKIIIYTGHLYSWKGVDTLSKAAAQLPTDYQVLFIGGTPEDIKKLNDVNTDSENVTLVGWKPHAEIPLWQKAADVLILPNTAKENISKYYTSPMKLFEYMASRVPIVASRIPSIEEIVTDDDVFFTEADNAVSLAQTIQKAVGDSKEAESKTSHAYERVQQFTWSKRAKRIRSFIQDVDARSLAADRAKLHLLVRYLFAGGLSFVSNLALFAFFDGYLHIWYVTASTLAFVISVVVSFLAQKFITFRDRSRARVGRQFGAYLIIALFNVIMNGLMIFAFVDWLHLSHLLAQVLSAGFIAVWSLGVYRYIIFPNAKIS